MATITLPPQPEDYTASKICGGLDVGVAGSISWRLYMEDRFDAVDNIVSVFDGHGGVTIADLAADGSKDGTVKSVNAFLADHIYDAENNMISISGGGGDDGEEKSIENKISAVRDACISAYEEFDRSVYSVHPIHVGAVAVSVILNQGYIHIVNIGDCEAIVVFRNGRFITATTRHTPASEDVRIIESGGFIADNRLCGTLAISRSFGDFVYKGTSKCPGPLIATPSVASFIADSVDFIIAASDGLWDVVDRRFIAKSVRSGIRRDKSLRELSRDMLMEAKIRGSRDNITVSIIRPLSISITKPPPSPSDMLLVSIDSAKNDNPDRTN